MLISLPFRVLLADIAPNPMTGGRAITPFQKGSTDVRMVDEDVAVRVYSDSIVAIASFTMLNEGEDVDMEVGFPFAYPTDLLAFRARVDGLPIEVHQGETRSVIRDKKVTTYWKLWNMSFSRGKRCRVRVEYKTKPMHMQSFTSQRPAYTSLTDDELRDLRRVSTTGSVEYRLESGKGWKGILDSCRVSFELVGLSGAHVMDFWPKEGRADGNRLVWEYTDYKPSGFMTVRYSPNMPTAEVPVYLCDVVRRHPDDASLASDVATSLRSTFNRGDLGREVIHSFLAGWDKPIPQLMEYASGGRCRFDYNAGGDFYTVWRMASILFDEYGRAGDLEEGRDIAANVSRITGAVVDSLQTCELPEQDLPLLRRAAELLSLSSALIGGPPAGGAR